MDGVTLQALVAKGYGKAASRIGTPHSWYRGGAITPIQPANLLGTLPAVFSPDAQFKTIAKQATILWRAFVDTSQVQVGDILVGSDIWVMVDGGLRPPMAMLCTDTITVTRAVQSFTTGGGAVQTTTPILTGWPCNMQLKRDKGFSEPVGFPGPSNSSAPMPEWTMYLPLLTDDKVQAGDMFTDDDGNAYKMDAVSYGFLGAVIATTPYQPNA